MTAQPSLNSNTTVALNPIESPPSPAINSRNPVPISMGSRTNTAHQLNMSCTVAPENASLKCLQGHKFGLGLAFVDLQQIEELLAQNKDGLRE